MFCKLLSIISNIFHHNKHTFYDCRWTMKQIRNGKVVWEMTDVRNDLADEGEKNMLNTYFRGVATPTEFYIRLCNDTLTETDTLATVLNEPIGNNYSPQLVPRSVTGFPTIEQHEGDWRVWTLEAEFSAIGGVIGPVTTAYLATTSDNSGLLIGYVALTLERTIADGDKMLAQLKIKLK